jgi:hypothetical protein
MEERIVMPRQVEEAEDELQFRGRPDLAQAVHDMRNAVRQAYLDLMAADNQGGVARLRHRFPALEFGEW